MQTVLLLNRKNPTEPLPLANRIATWEVHMQIWTPAFNIPHLGLTEKQNKTTTQAQNRDPVF